MGHMTSFLEGLQQVEIPVSTLLLLLPIPSHPKYFPFLQKEKFCSFVNAPVMDSSWPLLKLNEVKCFLHLS